MSKYQYTVVATRETAVLYLAWEWGLNAGQKQIKKMQKHNGGWRVSDFATLYGAKKDKTGKVFFSSRNKAESFLSHVARVAAYQQGRLGKPLRWCGRVEVSYAD